MSLILLLAACAHPVPIAATALPEGNVALAIVGTADVAGEVTAAVLAGDVQGIVLLGDPERRPWAEILDAWRPAADAGAWIRPLAPARRLDRFAATFPGVPAYEAVEIGGLRLVFTDATDDPDRVAEQMYWLPRAMADDTPKIVFVPPGPSTDAVAKAAMDYAPASAPALAVFTIGPESDGTFPGGGYGEARATVGAAWWTLQVIDTAVLLTLEGPQDRHWRWDPDSGWKTLPPGRPPPIR